MQKPTCEYKSDLLRASVYASRDEMGRAAAEEVLNYLTQLQSEQDRIRVVVASAPSQNEFFHYLTSLPIGKAIDWRRLTVFHMDEYVGLEAKHPQSFRAYQYAHFLNRIPDVEFHPIQGEAKDLDKECLRLSGLLNAAPIDLVCCGIGENGHLAFNDPPVADFEDPLTVKVVELDETCRQQQVNDGCFATLPEVPVKAITLTLKVFAEAKKLSCVVPAASKAEAVRATLRDRISTRCPATLMRSHPCARLFLDQDSAALL